MNELRRRSVPRAAMGMKCYSDFIFNENRIVNRWMDGWMDGWMDEWMDE